jgi:hypothetical protein
VFKKDDQSTRRNVAEQRKSIDFKKGSIPSHSEPHRRQL